MDHAESHKPPVEITPPLAFCCAGLAFFFPSFFILLDSVSFLREAGKEEEKNPLSLKPFSWPSLPFAEMDKTYFKVLLPLGWHPSRILPPLSLSSLCSGPPFIWLMIRKRFIHPMSWHPFGCRSRMTGVQPTSLLAAAMEASHLS